MGRGREVLPPMPIPVYNHFTDRDLEADLRLPAHDPPGEEPRARALGTDGRGDRGSQVTSTSMTILSLPRKAPAPPRRAAGPVLTPTQRPGLLAAIERALQRASRHLGGTLRASCWLSERGRRAAPAAGTGCSTPSASSVRSSARLTSLRTLPWPFSGSPIQKPTVSSRPSAAKSVSCTAGAGSAQHARHAAHGLGQARHQHVEIGAVGDLHVGRDRHLRVGQRRVLDALRDQHLVGHDRLAAVQRADHRVARA